MLRRRGGCCWPLLLPLVLAGLALSTLARSVDAAGDGDKPKKRDLRHTLALAKYLDCGIILTGIYRHYWDIQHKFGLNSQAKNTTDNTTAVPCFKERVKHFMDIDEVLDRKAIEDWLPVASVSELKAQGWNGELDAVMYTQNWWHLGKRDVDKALAASGVTVASDAEHVSLHKFINCEPSAVSAARKTFSKHRFVGILFVLLGGYERPRIHKELAIAPADTCKKVQHQANRLIHPAPWIAELARKYAQQHLGDEPYLAVHIRPYPDSCLDEWRNSEFDAAKLKKRCLRELSGLHKRLGTCTKQLMAEANLTRIFVMTHPVIRTVVDSLLQKDGLKAHYLDVESVAQLAGCHDSSATFIAMVEEQVAVLAHTLLGTSTSSITQTIAYERMGKDNHRNKYFEFLEC